MIPKLHKKGVSFRGAALYLLHDKDVETRERIAWTETRNLATDNPDAAWRVMAATALDASRLKQEAGIKATGRKSKDSVLHLTLSWHPDEAEGLSRAEMLGAAEGALAALKADRHQALIVCHSDEEQPHVHLLINRVSTEDGRMLCAKHERLVLSRWAQEYEEQRGRVLCPERVVNNAARARGQFVRGKPDKPRHVYELEAAHRDQPWFQKIQAEQKKLDLELRKKEVLQQKRQAEERKALLDSHRERKKAAKADLKREVTTARQAAGEAFLGSWAELQARHEQERQAFAASEQSLLGQAGNVLRAIRWRGLLQSGPERQTIREAFGLLSSRGARADLLRRQQDRESSALQRDERQAKKLAEAQARSRHDAGLLMLRARLGIERQEQVLQHTVENQALVEARKVRRVERIQAWEHAKENVLSQEFESVEQRERDEAARSFLQRMRKARAEKERQKSGRLSERFGKHGRGDDGWDR